MWVWVWVWVWVYACSVCVHVVWVGGCVHVCLSLFLSFLCIHGDLDISVIFYGLLRDVCMVMSVVYQVSIDAYSWLQTLSHDFYRCIYSWFEVWVIMVFKDSWLLVNYWILEVYVLCLSMSSIMDCIDMYS